MVLGRRELGAEAQALAASGIEDVLIVAGEDRRVVSAHTFASATEIVAPHFRSVGVEVAPLEIEEYAQLHRAGVGSVTIYQETYDPRAYRRAHRAGRKRNFGWRLHTPERVLAGGIGTIGIGALLGLSSWRFDGMALFQHALYLRERFGDARLMISFPRLRALPDGARIPAPVGEAELVHLVCALRLLLPDVDLVLSTRESPALRDHIAPVLFDRISAGSRTSPGAYQGQVALSQFELHDLRSPAEVCEALRRRGATVA